MSVLKKEKSDSKDNLKQIIEFDKESFNKLLKKIKDEDVKNMFLYVMREIIKLNKKK